MTLPFLSLSPCRGQVIRRPAAAPYIGFGACSQGHRDVFSFVANPASLVTMQKAGVGLYSERRFLLSELSYYQAAAVLPTNSGNFGLKARYFGFSGYSETSVGLAYGRSLGASADIGICFNYNGVKIAGYGESGAPGFEAGAVLHISDKLHTAIHIDHPLGGKPDNGEPEKLPFIYTSSLGYEASAKFFFSVGIIKEQDEPINVETGIEYRFVSQFLARLGLSAATGSFWFGAGFSRKAFRFDVTAAWHPQLGITPGLLLIYQGKEDKR